MVGIGNQNFSKGKSLWGLLRILLMICFLLSLAGQPSAVLAEAKTITHKIQASSDDTYANASGSLSRNNTLYFPYSSNDRMTFLRWPLFVLKEASISSAFLRVRARDAGDSQPSAVRLQVVDADHCPSLDANPYGLPTAENYIDWELPGNWVDGEWVQSVDISPLIQEFVHRPGYQYGQAICLRISHISGGWKRVASWDGNAEDGAELVIGYSGGKADLELYMADPEVRVAQKIYCQIETPSPSTDRLQARLDGQIIFEKNGNLQPEEVFVANYRALRAGQHELVVRIVDEHGAELAAVTKRWKTLHDGVPKVGIDENNAICVDGEPFFPITPFMLDPSKLEDWPYPAPLDMGSNINALYVEGYYPEHTAETWADYIQKGYTQGFLVGGPGRWQGFNSEDPRNSDNSKLVEYVERTRDLPGLFAWNWDDEPNLGSIETYNTAVNVREWMELTHAHDTNHPVWNLYYGYDFTHQDSAWHNSRIKEYSYLYNEHVFGEKTAVADVVSFDYYPYEYATWQDWVSLEDYTLALDRAREWNYNLFPVATCIETQDLHDANAVGHEQACGWPKDQAWTPDPTPEQLNNLIWVSIIHGAKALQYFQYFCPIPQENMRVLQQVKQRIEELTPVILGPDETTVKIQESELSGGRIDIMFRERGGKSYLFAANLKEAHERGRFSVPGLTAGAAIEVYGEGRSIVAGEGFFEDDFSALGVHIYIWPAEGELPIFEDVPFNHWANGYIEELYNKGYIEGCSTFPRRYCPELTLNRAEAAVFVVRGLHAEVPGYMPPTPMVQYFDDVLIGEGQEWFGKWVTELKAQGYTDGCSKEPPMYCPSPGHKRAEATVFFWRMLNGPDAEPPETSEQIFQDVPPTDQAGNPIWYHRWVTAAYQAGIIQPCQTDMVNMLFRPEEDLTRDEAACMLFMALGLSSP